MKTRFGRALRILVLALPLILGTIGLSLVEESDPFLHRVFLALNMYVMNYSDLPGNAWIEIARWVAPLATVSGVFMVISAMRERLHNSIVYLRGKSTAVYGPEVDRTRLLNQLGKNGIEGKGELVRAKRYVLADSETANIEFYHQNFGALKDSQVYMKCDSLRAQAISNPNLHLYCPEETAARIFWKEKGFYELSVACGHRMNIVLLGFGKLGQELLLSALQNNVFSPSQHIEYHVFGQDEGFSSVHTQLSQVSDPVIFHDEHWSRQINLIEQAQCVIVLEQQHQLKLVQELLMFSRRERIHVFSAEVFGMQMLEQQKRLACFNWQEEGSKLENIFGDVLFDRAKRINLRYAYLYGNVEENDENREREWNALDAFTRYSNIRAADYHEIQRGMLSVSHPGAKLDAKIVEWLAELEHISWNRYHFLNNWQYGIPENGKNKDFNRRIHVSLVPYDALSEEDKQKDRNNIELLFSME